MNPISLPNTHPAAHAFARFRSQVQVRSVSCAAVFLLLSLCLAPRQTAAQAAPTPAANTAKDEEAITLSPFEVNTARDVGYISRQATASGRVAQSLEHIPQSITIVNAAMIEDIAATSAVDALRFAAGSSPNNDERNGVSINIRGFNANAMRRNGELVGNGSFPMAEFTEQIELVKGPAAVLYGASQPGGLVNVVTKNPRYRPATSLTLTGFGLSRTGGYSASLDTTGPLPLWRDRNGKSRLAYRIVAVHERREDFRLNDDRVNRDGLFAKLTATPFEGLTIQSEFEKYQMSNNIPSALILAASELAKPNARDRRLPDTYLPIHWSPQSDDSRRYNYQRIWQNAMTYTRRTARFGDWTARMFVTLEGNYNYREQTVATGAGSAPRPVVQADLGKVVNLNQTVTQKDIDAGRLWVPSRNVQKSLFYNGDDVNAQWDITGKFEIGTVTNTMLLGTQTTWGSRNSRVPAGGRTNEVLTAANYSGNGGRALALWVDSPNTAPVPVNWSDIRSPSNPNGTVTQVWQGSTVTDEDIEPNFPWINVTPDTYYLHDDIAFFQERGIISLGVRHDEIVQNVLGRDAVFDQWTYRYGAVAKLRDWIHIYGSHSESFTANSAAAANDLGRVIPPQEGVQDEVGVRLSLWEKRLSIKSAAFRLTNDNLVVRNSFAPVGAPPEQFWTFIDGTDIKGFDVDVSLSLNMETQLLFSYAYLDGSNSPTPEQLLAQPSLKEIPLNQTARNQFTFWAKWTARSGRLKHFSVRAGYRWVDERAGGRLGFLPDMWLPSYGIVDLGVGYKWKRFTTDLLVRNVFDTYAFRSTGGASLVFPEKPRNATFRVKYDF